MWYKTKSKNKKYFCRYCLQCPSNKKVLKEYKDVYLKINGKQNVKLKSRSITFKNYHKQLPASLKTYVDFECNVKKDKSSSDRGDNASYTEDMSIHILWAVCFDDNFIKSVVLYRGKNVFNNFIEVIFKEYEYLKKLFNTNLVTSVEDKQNISTE